MDVVDREVKAADIYLEGPNAHHLAGSPNACIGLHNPYAALIVVSKGSFTLPERNCIHMEFDITGAPPLKYRCGDYLAVWPVNPDGEVERLMRVLGWDEKSRHIVIKIKAKEQARKVPIPSPTHARES